MSRDRAAATVIVIGAICVAFSDANVAILSPLCGLVAVIAVPAFAGIRYADSQGAADGLERAGYACAGLALSCWSVWLAGLVVGLGRLAVLTAPVAVSAIVVATLRTTSESGSSASDMPDAGASRGSRATVWATAAVTAALVAVPFVPYGWQRADGVHRMGMTDWYKHLMVATALQESTFPPSNPFLLTDGPAPYYYGFHLLAATVQAAAGVADVYVALLALTLLTAAAFPIVLFVLARGLFGDARRATVAAVGGTLLAGFDLVVWVLHAIRDIAEAWPLAMGTRGLRAAVPSTHLDFWIHHNERQFNPPYVSLIWAPQHVAAVVLALLVFHAMRGASRARRVVGGVLPAVMLAALPAFSAYVAVGLAAGVVGCVVVDAWRERRAPWRSAAFLRWRSVGLLAAVAAIPVLWVLAGGTSGQLTLAVPSAGSWLNGAAFSAILGDNTVTRLLDTPALYAVELGVIGLLGVTAIRARIAAATLSGSQRDAVTVVAAILVLVTVVRPSGDGPNNLYARPMLIVWSLLACFAADAWCAGAGRRRWRHIGVAIGAGGILLGAVGATAEGFAFWGTPADLVRAARWINADAAPDAIVAADPERHNLGYWLRRRTVVADRRHALLFGATGEQYDDTLARLRDAYAADDPVEAARRFAELGADVVIVESPAQAWGRSPCFEVGYRGERVTVLTRSSVTCVGPKNR